MKRDKDTFIRVPAVAARDLDKLTAAISRFAADIGCVTAGELQRAIGRVVVLDRRPSK